MSFQTWCAAKHHQPKKVSEIIDSLSLYLRDDPEIMSLFRGTAPDADATATSIVRGFIDKSPPPAVKPAPAAQRGAPPPQAPVHGAPPPRPGQPQPAQRPAAHAQAAAPQNAPAQAGQIAAWKQKMLQTIDTAYADLKRRGGVQVAKDVNDAKRLNPLVDETSEIPSPYDFYGKLPNQLTVWAKSHVTGYIDYIIGAINTYVDTAVSHSNRRKKNRDEVIGLLRSASANSTFLPDNSLIDYGIFNKKMPGARPGVADNIDAIATYWSDQRTGTAARVKQFEDACAAIAGGETAKHVLRRYGSTAEAEDIRAQRGFFQKAGISFEQYKWFVDLGIEGATTSVDSTDRSFWVKLKTGADAAIRGLEQEYDKTSVPPVIHKPDMGGEKGCFGVHEDCLVAFNTRMISSIEIKVQQTGKTDGALVKP